MANCPLVSVVIITYNSSEYVLDTLQSAYDQDYSNIEVVVSDDCSTDNTTEVVENWFLQNGNHFVRTKLVKTNKNTGIPANCNRGIINSEGEWIRLVAGDDLLAPNSIRKQVEFAQKSGSEAFVGDILNFVEKNGEKVFVGNGQHIDSVPWFFEWDAQKQYRYLLRHYDLGLGISSLFKRFIYDNITMYDEKYRYEEDTLFQLNITKGGICYRYIKEPIMYYRMHESISTAGSSRLMNQKYEDSKWGVRKDHIYPEIPWYDIIYWETELVELVIYFLVFYIFGNKNTIINRRIIKILRKCMLLPYWNRVVNSILRRKWQRRKSKKCGEQKYY